MENQWAKSEFDEKKWQYVVIRKAKFIWAEIPVYVGSNSAMAIAAFQRAQNYNRIRAWVYETFISHSKVYPPYFDGEVELEIEKFAQLLWNSTTPAVRAEIDDAGITIHYFKTWLQEAWRHTPLQLTKPIE